MDDGSPTLEVGFAVQTGGSFEELRRLGEFMETAEYKAVASARQIEQATGGMVNLRGQTAQIEAFGNAYSREMQSARKEAAQAEKAGEGMVRQLQRQIETFGKTTSEIRNLRAETRAIAADQRGLTELAARIRAVNAEMNRLEGGAGRAAGATGATRSAMQGLSFQAQDAFTQISMGTNVLSVLAIQGGQAAGQMANMGGRLGSIASFMIGPWGLAITGGMLALGALTKGLFDNEEASKAAADGMKKFQERQADIANFIDATTGKLIEQNRVMREGAILLRQKRIEENQETIRSQRDAALNSVANHMLSPAEAAAARRANPGRLIASGALNADPDVQRLRAATGGDIEKMSSGLFELAKRRPDLRGLATDFSASVGQAIILTRENRKLGEEVDQLSGKTAAQGKVTTDLIKRQVELATATTPLAHARAQLALVEQGAAAADKAGGNALGKYRADLTAATNAVNAAEAAERAAAGARRDGRKEASAAAREAKEAQRDYEAIVKAASGYAEGQQRDAERIGKSAKEIRLLEDAAQRAKAPTDALKKAIDDAAAAREKAISGQNAKDFATNILQPLKDELALYGLVGPARDLAALGLEKEAFMARNIGDGVAVATQRWNEYYAAKSALIGKAAADAEQDAQVAFGLDMLKEMEAQAALTGNALRDAFGSAGGAIADMIGAMKHYGTVEAEIAAQRDKDIKAAGTNQAEISRITILAAEHSKTAQLEQYGAIVGAAKGLFKEHSAGYKAMAALEKVYAALQLVNMVKSMAMDTTQTAASVANSTVRGAADTAAGGAKIFGQLGVFAFPVVAAMIALLASLGGKSRASGVNKNYYADAMQDRQGTGTVLGDSTAKSESLSRALDIMSKNSIDELEYSNEMVRSLRSIDSQMGALTNNIARQIGAGTLFNTQGLDLGTNTTFNLGGIGKALNSIPIVGGLLGGLFGSKTVTKKLVDSGLEFNNQALSAILAQGALFGQTYQRIETKTKKSSLFGSSTKTKYNTKHGDLDDSIERQAGLVIGSIYDSVLAAGETIGLTGLEELFKNYTVKLGKISLKDLKGDDLSAAINSVFSAEADKMAAYAAPMIAQYQKVGEGLFETLMRVAKDFQTIDVQMKSIGRTFGAVGLASLEAREGLIDLFGSIDEFASQTGFYREHFLTEAQQIAPVMDGVTAELSRLGLTGVDTIAEFKGVVDGLDLTTEAGRQLYAAMMALAPGFSAVEVYQDAQAQAATDLAKKRADMEITLLGLQGNAAAALARQRAAELAAMDESLRPLQQQIYLAQDLADARKVLTDAYNREKDALTATKTRFEGFSTSLKTFRDGLYSADTGAAASYRSLQVKLMTTGALATAGDETALAAFQDVGKDFLDAARNNAGSLAQYQRDVAMVARYATSGAAAATDAMDYAQAQLSALDAAVQAQIDINDSVISVHDALLSIEALLQPGIPGLTTDAGGVYAPTASAAASQPVAVSVEGPSNKEVIAELGMMRTGIEAIAFSNNDINRRLAALDGGGFLSVGTLDGDVISVRDVGS